MFALAVLVTVLVVRVIGAIDWAAVRDGLASSPGGRCWCWWRW